MSVMNKHERERWEAQALLAESGELSAEARAALEQALAADPVLARLAAENRALMARARAVLPGGVPPAAVREQIRAEALRRQGRRGWRLLSLPAFRHAVACAAVLTIAVSAWLMRVPRPEETPQMQGSAPRVGEMHALVNALRDNGADNVSATPVDAEDHEQALRALARELLAMEGLTLEGERDADEVGDWEPTAGASPLPTTSPPRSTPAPPARIRG